MAKDKTVMDDELFDEIDELDDEEEKSPKKGVKAVKQDKNKKDGKADKKKKAGPGKKIAKYFRDSKGEFKKIIWPTKKTLIRNTMATIAMCAIVGAAVSLFDFGLSALIDLFIKMG